MSDSIAQQIYDLLQKLLAEAQQHEQSGQADAARMEYQQIVQEVEAQISAGPPAAEQPEAYQQPAQGVEAQDSADLQDLEQPGTYQQNAEDVEAQEAIGLNWQELSGAAQAGLERLDLQELWQHLREAEQQEQDGNHDAAHVTYQETLDAIQNRRTSAVGHVDWERLVSEARAGLNRLDGERSVTIGTQALKNRDFLVAAGAFRKALGLLGQDHPTARQGLAETLYQMGREDEKQGRPLAARDQYTDALSYNPNHQEARVALQSLANIEQSRKRGSKLIIGVSLLLLLAIAGFTVIRGLAPPRKGGKPPVTSSSPTPVVGPVATPTLPATSSPTIAVSASVVVITPSPSLTVEGSPVPNATATPTDAFSQTVSLTFAGRILLENGKPFAHFRNVQLYGSMEGDQGTNHLGNVAASASGEFTIQTDKNFPFYLLWLEPAANPSQYNYIATIPGPGGEAAGSRMIRFRNPGPGNYPGNVFYIAVNISTPTDTPTATTKPTAANTPMPSPTPFPAPVLIGPDDGASVSDQALFQWRWSGGALPPNHGFEVRLWKENQADHFGAANPVSSTSLEIHFEGAYGVSLGGAGRYYWTVAVVQLQPYQRVGPEAPVRVIDIADDAPPPPPPSIH